MSQTAGRDRQEARTPLDELADITSSFILGVQRLTAARAAALSYSLAYRCVWAEPQRPSETKSQALERLVDVKPEEQSAFEYVTDISHLVYATTLLDSFLSDVTKFLVLLYPAALGKGQSVTIDQVLIAVSPSDLINAAVAKKVRELGYLPFLARVDYLRDTFGIRPQIPSDVEALVDHYSGIRHVVVHDQSVFEIRRDASGTVSVHQKTCQLHPTPIDTKQIWGAWRAYWRLAKSVFYEVATRVLKCDESSDRLRQIIRFFDRLEQINPTSPAA